MKTTEWKDKAIALQPGFFDAVTTCLVLVPHPDDESLGCGGLIAMLREKGKEVFVLFITDGSLSHPNSKQYPAEKLSALRKEEAIQALKELGVPREYAFFLNKKDGALPAKGEPYFERNSSQLHLLITMFRPDLIVVPYEKDPHRDHRATWQMLAEAAQKTHIPFRILQYIIWLHERGEKEDMPGENALRYLDITPYQPVKQEAIRQHLSQTTRLIEDDPRGFILSPEVLAHFNTNREYYIEQSV